MSPRIFQVGLPEEVEHHVQPLRESLPDGLDVEIVSPEDVVDMATAQDLAIFFSEHFHRFRTAVEQLKGKGCRTLYAIDGILEWRNAFENRSDEPACPWTMRPVLSHKVACIGRSQARQLAFWGNGKKVELIGLPRLDAWCNLHQRSDSNAVPLLDAHGNYASGVTDSGKNPDGGKTPRRILVMTAKWPAFTDAQMERVVCGLRDLKTAFEQWPGRNDTPLEIVWRLTRGLDEILGVENAMSETSGTELQQLLKSCDALITTPSTAMLEGMIAGIPTAILEFNACPQLTLFGWQIRAADQVEPTVRELLDPPPNRLAQQEFVLHDTLELAVFPAAASGAEDFPAQSASDRMTQLIVEMLKYPADAMPEAIVPIRNWSSLPDPAAESTWHNYSCSSAGETAEVQAHAAQLERDVKILEARNAILEREFERAKATIDGVIQNPVVSPILKAGELAGRFFRKPSN